MSREIKFRALNSDGQWCYGLPYYDKSGDISMSLPSGHSVSGDIRKTLGQYTGLKDINNVEIYDGDIVIQTGFTPRKMVVNRSPDGYKMPKFGCYRDGNTSSELSFEYEVIGNIHQNPELLK